MGKSTYKFLTLALLGINASVAAPEYLRIDKREKPVKQTSAYVFVKNK